MAGELQVRRRLRSRGILIFYLFLALIKFGVFIAGVRDLSVCTGCTYSWHQDIYVHICIHIFILLYLCIYEYIHNIS